MRVNMDSSIVFDPRFKMLAKSLGISLREVYGSCFLLWLHCYQSRSVRLAFAEADSAADVDGFAAGLVAVGLADDDDGNQKALTVHGVSERIRFLGVQKKSGGRGGRASAKSKRDKILAAEADAKRSLEQLSSDQNIQIKQCSSPSPTLSPTLSPSPALPPSSNTPLPPQWGDGGQETPKSGTKKRVRKPRDPNAPRKQREPDLLFDAIAKITGADPKINASLIGSTCALLRQADPPYEAIEVYEFGRRFNLEIMTFSTSPPTINQLRQHIGKLRNGTTKNGTHKRADAGGYDPILHPVTLIDDADGNGTPGTRPPLPSANGTGGGGERGGGDAITGDETGETVFP